MRLLIIGALGGQIGAASQIAVARGSKVSQAENIDAAMKSVRAGKGADVVMIDSGLDIAGLVSMLESERIDVPVVACGVGNDSTIAVRAIKSGAQEYIPLPPDAELISAVLEAVSAEDHSIIHKDPAMTKALALAEQVANSTASVMVVGESGTGKELFARAVHEASDRHGGPFVVVDCSGLPETLFESELCGHEKG